MVFRARICRGGLFITDRSPFVFTKVVSSAPIRLIFSIRDIFSKKVIWIIIYLIISSETTTKIERDLLYRAVFYRSTTRTRRLRRIVYTVLSCPIFNRRHRGVVLFNAKFRRNGDQKSA